VRAGPAASLHDRGRCPTANLLDHVEGRSTVPRLVAVPARHARSNGQDPRHHPLTAWVPDHCLLAARGRARWQRTVSPAGYGVRLPRSFDFPRARTRFRARDCPQHRVSWPRQRGFASLLSHPSPRADAPSWRPVAARHDGRDHPRFVLGHRPSRLSVVLPGCPKQASAARSVAKEPPLAAGPWRSSVRVSRRRQAPAAGRAASPSRRDGFLPASPRHRAPAPPPVRARGSSRSRASRDAAARRGHAATRAPSARGRPSSAGFRGSCLRVA
jgi:hypothetical protein